ncbi:hypothetical protein HUW51_02515 [Adhaeribacter swui]|uniref:Glycosyltransferase family 39 protein n=1 Tax=Adhaeribacter swui TaxID=2086471 RepID=A0A7G7G3B7_9BACT|nr:mannosyltransferase family protein [Adhaeribacter swui]QNF31651.1 hypothetical protein HUW51_02515 [Adhaeribacter swui]
MKLPRTWANRIVFKSILIPYILHTVLVFGSVYFLADFFPKNRFEGFINPALDHSSFFIKQLLTWDAHWFTYIAETGYTEKTTVFFPLLIILIKTLSSFGIETGLAGFVICNVFTFLTFIAFYKLGRLYFTESETRRALMALAVFPTSFFLNSVYSESLFLFFSFLCLYTAQQSKYMTAGILGACAALTRNLGIFLCLILAYQIWLDYKIKHKLDCSMLAILFIPLALLAYILFNFIAFDDPVGFVSNQEFWGRKFSLPLTNLRHGFVIFREDLHHGFTPPYYGNNLSFILTVLSLGIMLLLSVPSKIRLPQSYLIIGWLWLLIPLFSAAMPFQPLYSLSRFTLLIFPIYFFWSRFNLPVLYYCYIGISSITLVNSVCLFVNGWWVG